MWVIYVFAVCMMSLSTIFTASRENTDKDQELGLIKPKEIRVEGTPYTPFGAVELALADAISIEALNSSDLQTKYVRYLSLHNIPKDKKVVVKALVDRALNALNPTRRIIKRTAVIPAASPDPILLRVDLQDYGIRASAWDFLAEKGSGPTPLPDPYFHKVEITTVDVFVEEEYTIKEKRATGKTDQKGNAIFEEVPVTKKRNVKTGSTTDTVFASAPWLAMEEDDQQRGTTVSSLIKLTKTGNPILRADWFIRYSTLPPAYYELMGLTKKDDPVDKGKKVYLEKDFEDLFNVDLKRAAKDVVAAVAFSKLVALHNRILLRYNTVTGQTGGSYWVSKDTATGIGKFDYIENLETFDNPAFDAQEIIVSGRNGLDFYCLTDNKKRLIDKAVADIAIHSDAFPFRLQDRQIYAGQNCMICHASGKINIRDKVRALANNKIGLLLPGDRLDKDKIIAIQEAFEPAIKPIIDLDNAKYGAAVIAATGMKPDEVGTHFEDLLYTYVELPITIDVMAREAGYSTQETLNLLKQGVNIHYSLTAVLQNPPEDVYRLTWESQGYANLMTYLLSKKLK